MDAFNKSLAVFVVGFALFTDFLLMLAVIPILPVYSQQLGISTSLVGLLFALKPACQVVATHIAGALADYFGRKKLMICGLFSLSGATLMFAFATTFAQLFAARCLQGVASATNAVSLAFLADVFTDSDERGKNIANAMMGISIGVMVGPLFGGWLFQWGGLGLPFFVGAGLVFVDGCLRFIVKDPE